MTHKVFISYDHSEDRHYKELLNAWHNHPNFEFEFDNRSPLVAINSVDASVIKAALTKKLKEATHILVIVGEKSYTSKWMNWEIEKAKELGLKIAAVKINSKYISPSELIGCGTSCATSFEEEKIVNALNDA